MTSVKQRATATIEQLPNDVILDEIVAAIWQWSSADAGGAYACNVAASRVMTTDPVTLVLANRSARDAAILGVSRQAALSVVRRLPDSASVSDILVALATWCWTNNSPDVADGLTA
jgi:hypothetical protein